MAVKKIEALRQKKARLEAQIRAIEAADKIKRRKEDTRLKVLIGAAILADIARHPETRGAVQPVVQRAITTDRDRDFMRAKGWI